MKLLCGPDLHIRVTNPEHRIDDFVEVQKGKIEWIARLAMNEDCTGLLLPGDITDHPKLPYHIVTHYIRLFRQVPFVTVGTWGQHDLLYHVSKDNTPLQAMNAGGAIFLPRSIPYFFPGDARVAVVSVGWEQDIPDIEIFGSHNGTNILLIHKMFVDDKLWEGQEEYKRANIFLRETKWDLIVSGDNHQHFMFQSRGRFHVNCGSLMRQNIDQIHHKPVVYIYDTEKRTLAPHYIPIRPPEEVFDIQKAQEKKEKSKEMVAFVEMVKNTTKIEGLDYAKNLDERMSEGDIDEDLMELHKEVMKNVGERLRN